MWTSGKPIAENSSSTQASYRPTELRFGRPCLICTRSMHLPVVTCIPFTLLEVGKRNVYANMPPRYLRNCVYLLTDSSSLMYKKRHVYKLCLVFLHSLYFYEFKFLKDCSSNQKLLNLILVKFLIVN